MSESQTALILNLKFANINFPRVRKRSCMEKLGHFILHVVKAPNFPSPRLFTQLDNHLKHTREFTWVPEGSLQTKASKFGKYSEA